MAAPEPGGTDSKGGNGKDKGNGNGNGNGEKKKKPPNLDLLKKSEKVDEAEGGLSPGGVAQKSPKLDSGTKTPRLDPSPKTPRSSSERSPKSPRPDASPSADPASLGKGLQEGSQADISPRSPKPQYPMSDSPKKLPDSPLRSDSSKQVQLLERHRERHGHHHDSHHSSPSEHRTLSKTDSTVSHRKHSTDSDEEGHHHHHHHHRSPKRTMSERRRHSQRASSTSHSGTTGDGTENRSEHRRTSSVGGGISGRRTSMRASDRRKSSFHDPHGGIVVGSRRISIDRMSHERMSISDGGTMNGSPVHIEYYKEPTHHSGPYMSPGLSSAYKTPAAEVLIASLIIIVGLVALITSWATGIKVWLVVGAVCVGLGGMFMLLGLCWYCALARQKQENEDLELKVLNSKQLLKLARTPSNASQNAPQMV